MGERKVLNKYYPPDFDPALIPRVRGRAGGGQIKVRTMLPFNIQCDACGDYIYSGRKFNARKEVVKGEDYLGIRILRFYIRCPLCNAEITWKTDPKSGGYTCEFGAKHIYAKWKNPSSREPDEGEADSEEKEEVADPMELLEQRQRDSRKEMKELDVLQRIQEETDRQAQVDIADIIAKNREENLDRIEDEEEDEEMVRNAFKAKKQLIGNIRKIDEEQDESEQFPEIRGLFANTNRDRKRTAIAEKEKSPLLFQVKEKGDPRDSKHTAMAVLKGAYSDDSD